MRTEVAVRRLLLAASVFLAAFGAMSADCPGPGPVRTARPCLFVWVELIGFDNTKADYAVGDYLARMDLKPEAVSILLNDDNLYLKHATGRLTPSSTPA